MDNFVFANFKENEKPASVSYNFKYEDQSIMPEMIYFNPMLQGKVKQNPFKNIERQFPVDFAYATDQTYKVAFAVPKDFIVESLPKTTNISLADKSASFSYSCTHDPSSNMITVISRINIKNPVYYTEQYLELRELYAKIVQKHDEQIVMKHN
jgi:hypothetical protein